MDNLNLISNFAEFKELKNIDKSTMIGVLEAHPPAGGGSSASRSAFRMALIQSLSCFIVLCESGSAG